MAKKRSADPWLPADEYGRSLPAFTVNLIVSEVSRSVAFYEGVLGAEAVYSDPDFAALKLRGADLMLHADHTYEGHPWHRRLRSGEGRGLGAELRLFEVDPDEAEARARSRRAVVLQPATDRPHGWRETWLQDPDGYVWAVGTPLGRGRK